MSKALLFFRNGVPEGMVDLEGAPITGGEGSTYEASNLEDLLSFNADALPYSEQVGTIIRYWTRDYEYEDGSAIWGIIDVLPSTEDGGDGGL
jgi:hypothetical protein